MPDPFNHIAEAALERELRVRLSANRPLAFLQVDLVNFRTYLEEYGFLQGDVVLELLARVIDESLALEKEPEDFVAHLGWDMFGIIVTPERAEILAQRVIASFDAQIPQHYNAEARRQGYVDRVDRRGNPYRAPLMGVAIAIVSSEKRDLIHPLQIMQIASEVRNYLQYAPSSRYAFDRRQK